MSCTELQNAPRVRLGELIEIYEVRNKKGNAHLFCGINKDKSFMPTVADTNELDNTKYKIVCKNMFAFSGMQTGRDVCIRLALYNEDNPIIISPAYTTFIIKDTEKIIPQFLFLFFSRFEIDRFGWFLSDSSIRSNLDWDRFCDIEIPLPSIEVQRELVSVYDGLQKIISENEALIEPLSAACHAFIVDCKNKYPAVKLGDWIEEKNDRNRDGSIKEVKGMSTSKEFREPNSRVNKDSLLTYKIVKANQFAYVPTTDTWKVFACALAKNETFVVSPIYCVFAVINQTKIIPDFLNLYFKQAEYDRYVRFNSWGSARENFSFSELQNVNIPFPPIEIQKSIVAVAHCLEEAKRIVRDAREQMKKLCPALVQKAAHSA